MEFDRKIKTILNCELCKKKPCLRGCPLNNNILKVIKLSKEEKFEDAYKVLSETSTLSSICGRICPHSKQCEGACVKKNSKKKVKIGSIEAYIGDLAINNDWKLRVPKETKYNVAVVGSGPAGLTCAAFLRKNGIGVTLYEKHDYLGGLLTHGIPNFRLPKDIVSKVTERIINMGIEVHYNEELGRNLKLSELLDNYDAIFIGIGANKSNRMHIKGEKLDGVYGANELLEEKMDVDFNDKVVVINGGGDVAMDVARTIKRKGAKEVKVLYRRSEDNITADIKEVKKAKSEGIDIVCETNIIEIVGNKKVKEIKTTKVDKELKNIKETEEKIPCDIVILAIGSHPDRVVKKFELALNDKGKILIDKDGITSNKKIFSGGDVAGTKSTVAWAARAGRNAAYSIIDYLNQMN